MVHGPGDNWSYDIHPNARSRSYPGRYPTSFEDKVGSYPDYKEHSNDDFGTALHYQSCQTQSRIGHHPGADASDP